MRWPGRAPETRPEIVSTRSRPPCAAGGTLVNAIAGQLATFGAWQPLVNAAHKSTGCRRQIMDLRPRSTSRNPFRSLDYVNPYRSMQAWPQATEAQHDLKILEKGLKTRAN